MAFNNPFSCPKCGGEEFITTAHVVQAWKVNGWGWWKETIEECEQVTVDPTTLETGEWSCTTDNCDWEGWPPQGQ